MQYYAPDQIVTNREDGEVFIPMIAFIEGGMTIPIGNVTRDYLINHRLTFHQCAPNLFRVLGSIDFLNEQMDLGLMWYDVIHMYECHKLAVAGYYLKSQSNIVRLISCFPKSNKGMKDDYLIVSEEWHDGLHCPTRAGDLGKFRSLGMGFSPFSFYFLSVLILRLPLMMIFIALTMIFLSDVFANKQHIAPKLSLVNIPALNILLRSEIFISKNG